MYSTVVNLNLIKKLHPTFEKEKKKTLHNKFIKIKIKKLWIYNNFMIPANTSAI